MGSSSSMPLPPRTFDQQVGQPALHTYSPPREREWNGGIYVLRDVLTPDGKFTGKCEYRVRGRKGQQRWLPCVDGVEYKDIKPFKLIGRRDWRVPLIPRQSPKTDD